MFGPWIETFIWLRSLVPSFTGFRRPSFNFITIHYLYIISCGIIGSIILYPGGNLRYIDCLFFGNGAATQAGLNTVNINDIYLYQQITLMLIACIANPIFINTFVVFVRLYWFEKRFQNVVLEARRFRRTRERTQSVGQEENGLDHDSEEKGVGDRKIVVMHPADRTIDLAEQKSEEELEREVSRIDDTKEGDNGGAAAASNSTPGDSQPETDTDKTLTGHEEDSNEKHEATAPTFRREVTFADEATKPQRKGSQSEMLLPQATGADKHIKILEEQRNPTDDGTLYIPGPRDFDKGFRPQRLEEISGKDITRGESVRSGVYPPVSPINETKGSEFERSHTTDPKFPLRKKIARRLSLDDTGNAISRARKGLVSRFHSTSHDVEKANSDSLIDENDGDTPDPSNSLRRRGPARTFASFMTSRSQQDTNPMPYLSYQPTMGRNSAFVNLTEQQREELGGIEYRATKTLAITLSVYYVGFHLIAAICLVPWIVETDHWGEKVEYFGISRVWWGFFSAASLFNDLGFTLTPNSMYSFKFSILVMLLGAFLIVIGNTGFPCMLRFIIWIASKCVPKESAVWEEFRFLLDHPRRCFTLLFPSKATWWLFWVLVLLNGLDLLFFIVLDLHDPVVHKMPAGYRILNGLFQASSTRTAGFSAVNLADLHSAIQVSYLIMMYISVYPIAISVRKTNVYEEKSLGMFKQGEFDDEDPNVKATSFVGHHLRRQLSFDLWYVFLGLFLIAIIEGGQLKSRKEYAFSLFAVLFEIVSAYGTVGLSLGYPGTDTSFSAQFHTLSKLIVIAMTLRGRHRGLPYALDKAILLPSEDQHRKEHETGQRPPRTTTADQDFATSQTPTNAFTRTNTARSASSNQSRKGGALGRLISSALSAGPSAKTRRD